MAPLMTASVFLTSFLPVWTDAAVAIPITSPLCTESLNIPTRPIVTADLSPNDFHIEADNADLETEGLSILNGNVEITRDDQQTRSDHAEFKQKDNIADLEGNIQYWDESMYLEAKKGHIEFKTETGQFENTRYTIKDGRGRGQSAYVEITIGIESHLQDVDYSNCDPKNKFWSLSADELHLDHIEDWGSAKNAVLRIQDIPVFYSPYLSFPLNERRKTGFLMPSAGSSDRYGFEATIPFYWNIAANMDATLTPQLLTHSGIRLLGEFRHISNNSKSRLNAEYLANDNQFGNKTRNLITLKHEHKFIQKGRFSLDYNRVSDQEYFKDFGNSLRVTSKRFLKQHGDVSYSGSWWNAHARVESYQSVDRTIASVSRPYKRLPHINFNARSLGGNNKLRYTLSSEFTYFYRGDENAISKNNVTGARLNFMPSIDYPYRTTATFLTPKLGLHYSRYHLNNAANLEPNLSRLVPVLSIDSGIFLERDFSFFGKKSLQTLEPRIFYVYVPEKKQDDLPVFDTGLYDFSFDSLFRENRFSSKDRFGDTNQVTLALTSRLIDRNSGKERAYVSLGQIYYLDDREVILPNLRKPDDNSTPIVAKFSAKLFDYWQLLGNVQWDTHTKTTEKLLVQMQYKPAEKRVINLSYLTRDTANRSSARVEQTDVSLHWSINQHWNMVGRWRYAIPKNRTLEIFGGIEYDSCCWGFRVVAQRFLIGRNGLSDKGLFLQFELKGLAGSGRKTVDFLKQKISGYKSD